ncbi:hypothetical protein CC1G_11826 [Coprinopsis cinerea okayama7|uniref:Protein prenyltransferase alpha subunit repeat-containing protein 1 n=1 Tax=Coprinopsis cinerea (strain Okayama-7 / 130 / ATCC MYA-4618 / FGSC 9003) TaxID=240176 RepID=A8N5S8_COPC7|nr:hypothetical protein CC1G_11826 [Coprinopsis cinerea okayama7\|eukprot:XP_001830223.1 hypothetical protein CC1G_11826 [Coprinopsis cinerea okayama7\
MDEILSTLSSLVLSQDTSSLEIVPGDWSDWSSTGVENNPPTAQFPFVLVDKNLGIPKKVLYRAYAYSHNFSRALNERFKEILDKTTCVMITNPAHQTALNARKRLILLHQLDVHRELHLTGLLLRGIKTCAKETILWDHRRWCLKQAYGQIHAEPTCQANAPIESWSSHAEASMFPNLPVEAFAPEFTLIRAACAIYPRNYHAWSHWHFVFDGCHSMLRYTLSDTHIQGQLLAVMVEECQRLNEWIKTHVSDFSAIHHFLLANSLLYNLSATHPSSSDTSGIFETGLGHSPAIVASLLWELLSSYPSHESLFLGLRSLLPQLSEEDENAYRDRLASLPLPHYWRK